jgi:hypothetical protein
MNSRIINFPFGLGRLALQYEREGAALRAGGLIFGTNLEARLFHRDRYQGTIDLGSGLVTNVGVLALSNDSNWSVTNAPNNLFRFLKYHATGTGVTAAAATDIKLQTASGNGGQTPVAGTQVLVLGGEPAEVPERRDDQLYRLGSGHRMGLLRLRQRRCPTTGALSDATGSPFTAGSGTTGTVTGTPLTASSSHR